MELGRWANERTARIYINTALLELAKVDISDEVLLDHALQMKLHLLNLV